MTKKTCLEVHQKMYSYLDGEIGRYRRWKIRRHLRQCPPCQDGFDFEVKLKDKIRDGCADEFPRELFERLMSSMRKNDPTGGG